MVWVKRGLIIVPAQRAPGSAPACARRRRLGDRDRVYFSSRDAAGGHIGYADLSLKATCSPSRGSSLARPAGRSTTRRDEPCVIDHGHRTCFYRLGAWQTSLLSECGLACSGDGADVSTRVAAPLLDRQSTISDRVAWVIVERHLADVGTSGTEWTDGLLGRHVSHQMRRIARRVSIERTGIVCLDYRSAEEYAFGRPCVIRDGNRYRMWYSYRGPCYRIGYAESADGILWDRRDSTCVVPPSDSGWDSEMTTYPVVVRRGDRLYMLYNGNAYGRTGIGLASSA
jgi:hypothetical protein